jgi:hypothetical protein
LIHLYKIQKHSFLKLPSTFGLQPQRVSWSDNKTSRQGYIAWTQFVTELYERFDTDTNHLGHLTKLKQSGTIEYFIAAFEGMTDAFFRERFISGLKEEIRAHVLMDRPSNWVEAAKRDKEAQQVVSSQN